MCRFSFLKEKFEMEFFQTEATTLEKVILQKAATAQRPINGTLIYIAMICFYMFYYYYQVHITWGL